MASSTAISLSRTGSSSTSRSRRHPSPAIPFLPPPPIEEELSSFAKGELTAQGQVVGGLTEVDLRSPVLRSAEPSTSKRTLFSFLPISFLYHTSPPNNPRDLPSTDRRAECTSSNASTIPIGQDIASPLLQSSHEQSRFAAVLRPLVPPKDDTGDLSTLHLLPQSTRTPTPFFLSPRPDIPPVLRPASSLPPAHHPPSHPHPHPHSQHSFPSTSQYTLDEDPPSLPPIVRVTDTNGTWWKSRGVLRPGTVARSDVSHTNSHSTVVTRPPSSLSNDTASTSASLRRLRLPDYVERRSRAGSLGLGWEDILSPRPVASSWREEEELRERERRSEVTLMRRKEVRRRRNSVDRTGEEIMSPRPERKGRNDRWVGNLEDWVLREGEYPTFGWSSGPSGSRSHINESRLGLEQSNLHPLPMPTYAPLPSYHTLPSRMMNHPSTSQNTHFPYSSSSSLLPNFHLRRPSSPPHGIMDQRPLNPTSFRFITKFPDPGRYSQPQDKGRRAWTGWKWALLVSATALLIYSLLGLASSLSVWLLSRQNADVVLVVNHGLLLFITFTSCFTYLLSLLAFTSTLLNSRPLLTVYNVMLWPSLILVLAAGYQAYHLDHFNLDGKLSERWSREWEEEGRLRIQNELKCCGFFSSLHDATFSRNCFPRSALPGCKASLVAFEHTLLKRVWMHIFFGAFPVHLIILVIAILGSNHVDRTFGKRLMPWDHRMGAEDVQLNQTAAVSTVQEALERNLPLPPLPVPRSENERRLSGRRMSISSVASGFQNLSRTAGLKGLGLGWTATNAMDAPVKGDRRLR
ncbi:hypothetical protein BT69DRAFT_1276860 [Atractiella rhizophila]|nr:hypothetical protein BT69DRAFT_1276860 [Atractiella rhizophila]